MMSRQTIRVTKTVVWTVGIFFAACIGVAAAVVPPIPIKMELMSGTSSVTFSSEWVFGAAFILMGGALKYVNDKLTKAEEKVSDHEARLAAGNEQLILLKEMRIKIDHIAEHGCARQCGEKPKPAAPSPEY